MSEPKRFDTVEEIIDFAIQREREAQDTYLSYARETERRSFTELLLSMAEMEREHERKLIALKQGNPGLLTPPNAEDLGFSEMLAQVPFSPDMDYGDFLILVIRKEREAEQLYRKLAAMTTNPDISSMLRVLADEERKHRDWAQERYDEDILKEN